MKPAKTRAGGMWTESRYFGFIRSMLRRGFVRWPPNYAARRDARRAYKGRNKLQKWEYKCAICGKWHMGKNTQIDHIEPCGSLRSYDDLPGFVRRLFCEADALRLLCKPCHKEVTQEQRNDK